MKIRKTYIAYLDVLNILACLAVLFLHHNRIVHYYDIHTIAWKQSLAIEVLCYWAVPIFLMLTGITLMNYRDKYTTHEFKKKEWCVRLFLSCYGV